LVENIIGELLREQPNVPITVLETVKEEVHFMPPRDLIALAMSR
jgi:4-hydroxy-3-methylbut-2-enyl diphosphate reductase